MCVIVNLDLVIPAAISSEFATIRCLKSYNSNRERYLKTMTISPDYVMSFAGRMKTLDLGRVVINFKRDDVVYYLRSNPDIFEEIDNSQVYKIALPERKEDEAPDRVSRLIENLTSKLNYSPRVLRTVGLWR